MDLILKDLTEPLTIEVVNQDRISVSQLCLNDQLEIHKHSFPADLIPFELGKFDVVLGMDWLSRHKVNIECKKKKDGDVTEDNIRVNYQRQRQKKEFLLIIKMKKLFRQGCEAHLAHIEDMEKEAPNLDEIPIAREFSDIFPDELPGLPSDREIEFTIDLIPEAKLVQRLHIVRPAGIGGIG
ncbi:uncharacterized protein LOC141660525 [Apium graveolens]|uniref:uncharacterized protein LOC141660525 n=1 Tax=Apium graveolens TaxID=4045 RepID=UPI003D7B79D1